MSKLSTSFLLSYGPNRPELKTQLITRFMDSIAAWIWVVF